MLKFKVKSLDGLPEEMKSHYKKQGEEYVLELDKDIKTEDDIRKLTTALEKERADHKATKGKLSKYDLSPEEVQEKLDSIEELKLRAGKVDDSKISELVSLRVKPYERENEKLKSKLKETETLKESLSSQLQEMKLNEAVRSVADGVVDPRAMQDAVLRAKTMLSFNEEKSGFYDKDGFDVKEWLEKTLPETNWAIQGSGGGSKGKGFDTKLSVKVGDMVFDAKNNPFNEEKPNLTHQSMIAKNNPELVSQFQELAKTKE